MTMIDPNRPQGKLVQGARPDTQIVQLYVPPLEQGGVRFRDQWNSEWFTCEPGERIFLPWWAAVHFFGHPDAVDIPGDRQRQWRLDEYRRLQVKYGVYDAGDEAFRDATPNVQLYTAAGERIISVIDDPAGEHLTPGLEDKQQIELMQAAMAEMQEQMNRMAVMVQQAQSANDATVQQGNTPAVPDAPAPIPPTPGWTPTPPQDVPMPEGIETAIPTIVEQDGPPRMDSPIAPKQG